MLLLETPLTKFKLIRPTPGTGIGVWVVSGAGPAEPPPPLPQEVNKNAMTKRKPGRRIFCLKLRLLEGNGSKLEVTY